MSKENHGDQTCGTWVREQSICWITQVATHSAPRHPVGLKESLVKVPHHNISWSKLVQAFILKLTISTTPRIYLDTATLG